MAHLWILPFLWTLTPWLYFPGLCFTAPNYHPQTWVSERSVGLQQFPLWYYALNASSSSASSGCFRDVNIVGWFCWPRHLLQDQDLIGVLLQVVFQHGLFRRVLKRLEQDVMKLYVDLQKKCMRVNAIHIDKGSRHFLWVWSGSSLLVMLQQHTPKKKKRKERCLRVVKTQRWALSFRVHQSLGWHHEQGRYVWQKC